MHVKLLLSLTLLRAVALLADAPLYHEPYRPQFHFTPERNWMNDPNGMVYYEGEYHLFYQYNPFGIKWGHMSWGHAVSRDLLHWEHLPVALSEENGVMIFSGSAVIDWKNTSGFGQNGKPPMVAIYTGHYTTKPLQNQHIAFSNDRGRTWIKYHGNPVLDINERDFRDPKVSWHEGTKRWIMTVAWPNEHKVRFYASPNLKEWTHLSDFGPAGSTVGIWECPDLFPIKVENSRSEKWLLVVNVGSGAPAGGSGCQYFPGKFDGTRFTLDPSYPKPQPELSPAGKGVADFEGNDYSGWQPTGNAFGTAPVHGKIGGQQEVSHFQGRGLVNSFLDGDKSEGTLTSPEFEITDQYLNFLIGGGSHSGKTCMNLLVGGKTVRTATGNDAERLSWKSWDVRELRGKQARLEIVDRHTGGWGHINVDQITLANTPASAETLPALWADYGPDFYAAVSWSDLPKHDGRRLWLGWMSNWQYANDVPTVPWRSAMSIPRELALRKTPEGLRLVQKPVRELEGLAEKTMTLKNANLTRANAWLREKNVAGGLWEMEVECSSEDPAFSVTIFRAAGESTILVCDPRHKSLSLDRTHSGHLDFHSRFSGVYQAPWPPLKGIAKFRLLVDTSSVEVFTSDGEAVLSCLMLPNGAQQPVQFSSADGAEVLRTLRVRKLRSVYK